jgi:hypothetical protein
LAYLPARLIFEDWSEILDIDYGFVCGDENMELCVCIALSGCLVEEFKLLDDVSGVFFTVERNNT